MFVISIVSSQFPRNLPDLPAFYNQTMFVAASNSTIPTIPLIYIPIFSLLEISFYLGWLKVAQSLLNPFGEDDEDFDLIPLMERNLAISLWMVDLQHSKPSENKSDDNDAQQNVSLTPLSDVLFFQQDPTFSSNKDPLSELLRSSEVLNMPDSLNENQEYENPQLGSAARLFERRESKAGILESSESIGGLHQRRKSTMVSLRFTSYSLNEYKFVLRFIFICMINQ